MGKHKETTQTAEDMARVRSMADLITHQEGSVVSRTIAKTPGGSVTLFAFDAGQGLSEHTAPYDAIVHVIEGETEITISGTPHRLLTGQMIVMPANQPHALRALAPFKMVLTMLKA